MNAENAITVVSENHQPGDGLTLRSNVSIAMPALPSLEEINALSKMSQIAAMSGFVNSQSRDPNVRSADAFFVMMLGRELGIPPMTALRTIYVIDGKPSCSGQAMLSLMRRAGVQIEIPDPATITNSVSIRVKRPGGEWKTYTYSSEMAQKANLSEKAIWKKYPREMLIWRAVSTVARMEAPDIIGGLYTIEEVAPANLDLNENGDLAKPLLPEPVRQSQPALPSSTPTVTNPQNPPPPINPVAITWDDERKKWLARLLENLGFAKADYAWIFEHLEPGKVLKGFSETALGIATLEKRLRELAQERNQPAQPKTQQQPANVSNLGEGMMNPFTVDHVRYYVSGDKKTAYLEFVAPTPIRAYGRSSNFKKLVGDTYYNANGFETMTPNTKEPYEIEALTITWAVKGDGQHKYLIAEKCEPLLVEEPDVPPPLPNGDQDLDAWFNNDPLPPEKDPFRFDVPQPVK